MKKKRKFSFDLLECLDDGIQLLVTLFPLTLLFVFSCFFGFVFLSNINLVDEKDCYSFYKENGLVLNACSKYEDKFFENSKD